MSPDPTQLAEADLWQARYYNGFSPGVRESLSRPATRAMKAGTLTRPTQCHSCGRRDGIILNHLEDYRAWADHFGMCIPCHKALHERFRTPSVFRNWVSMLASGERPIAWHDYNWSRFDQLYRFTPVNRWRTEPADRDGELFLFSNVSMTYQHGVPPLFDRMGGAPIHPGQHRGEVGPLA